MGFAILFGTGLPDRADFTGATYEGIGYAAPEIGRLAPPFQARLLDETLIEIVAERGRPVILNFWATWCPPCEAEMPELQAFHTTHPDVGLYGINLGENRQWVARWLADRRLILPVILDEDHTISRLYQIRVQPTTFVIHPDGRIHAMIYGPTSQHQLTQLLAEITQISENGDVE